MINPSQFRDLALPKAKELFNSIEPRFLYRKKHNYKFRFIEIITRFFEVFFILSVLPIIPLMLGGLGLTEKVSIKSPIYEFSFEHFWVRWLVSVFFHGIFFLLFFFINKLCKKMMDKYGLDTKNNIAMYLYKAIKEIETFKVNNRYEHIEYSVKYLDKYYNRNFLWSNNTLSSSEGLNDLNFYEILQSLDKKYIWIDYTPETKDIIQALKDIDSKVINRILRLEEIETSLDILYDFLICEYLYVGRSSIKQIFDITKDARNGLAKTIIISFTSKINNIQELDITEEKAHKKSIAEHIKNLQNSISDFFTHKNPLIVFFTWFIFLSALTIALIYIGRQFFDLEVDSTVYIGVISIPIIGAITCSSGVLSKRK